MTGAAKPNGSPLVTAPTQPSPMRQEMHCSRLKTRSVASSVTVFVRSGVVAFLISFGLIWIYVATCPMAFLDWDYPLWIAKRAMLDRCSLGSVAVFGDSRMLAGVDPRTMSLPVSNFALSGTSPIETYFVVSRALRCQTPPKLVVIAHGALMFTEDFDFWRLGVRIGYVGYDDVRRVEQDSARLHSHSIGNSEATEHLQPWLRDWLYSLRFPTFYFNSLVHGYAAARWLVNLAVEKEGLKSSGHILLGTAPGSDDIAGEAHMSRFVVSPLVDLYFSKTLSLLAERHIPVVILSLPVNRATYSRLRPQLRRQFADYLQMRTASFGNVTLSSPAFLCWPDIFYGDAVHFNAVGAEAFSHELDALLTHMLGGTGPVAPLSNRCSSESTELPNVSIMHELIGHA